MKKAALRFLALALAALAAYSGWQIWLAYGDYRAEAEIHDAVMEFKPTADEIINQSVIDLRAKYPDAVGWIIVPGTNIDYPFVQSKDNDYYLRRDLDGKYALASTLFMDYRCEKDFTSASTIIYGHHMKNGSMFGMLKRFADKAFFDKNEYGTIYLPYETITLEFFAYLVVKATDGEIYCATPGDGYLDYVRENARQWREISLTDEDKLVTLSTCAYEFDGARMVLLAKTA